VPLFFRFSAAFQDQSFGGRESLIEQGQTAALVLLWYQRIWLELGRKDEILGKTPL
jgi:hypothetical protein